MKLRQKLAAVLATAMIVTSIPVVTMGASTNNLAKEVVKVVENHEFDDVTTSNAIKVAFKDNTTGTETFYLELTNAQWTKKVFDDAVAKNNGLSVDPADNLYTYTDPVTNAVVKYDLQGATETKTIKVKVDLNAVTDKSQAVRMPLVVATKTGDASVELLSRGGETTITTGSKFVFATTSDKVATATVQDKDDVPTIYRDGKIGEIYLDENYSNAFAKEKEYTYTVEFDNTEYDFVSAELAGQYGFSGAKFTKVAANDAFATTGADDVIQYKFVKLENAFQLKVFLGKDVTTDSLGRLIVKNIEVESTSKAPETGDFIVDIKGDTLSSKLTDVVLAKVSKYAVALEMNKESIEEIVAGRTAEIKFELKETVKDSIAANRELTLAIENSEFDYQELIAKYGTDADECKEILANDQLTAAEKARKIKKLSPALDLDEMVKDGVMTNDDNMIASIKFDRDEDGNIDPTTLVAKTGAEVTATAKKVSFKMPVHVSIADKDAEKIQITAGGRAMQDEVTVDAARIVNPFDVTTEAFVVKVGLQGQVGGSIKLTETQAEMFKKGDIQIKVKDAENVGITFTKDAKLTTEGGLKSTSIKTDKANKNVTVTLNRTSNEASSITISDFTVSVDRTVPEGSYDLEISGPSIDEKGQSIIIKDFIVVGTQNTEDVETANGLAKGVSTFVIGESKYTINGEEKVMDAASYIQDPGYTMVPVRYVAEAFGVTGNNILFSKGVATIFAGNRTIQLTNGSDIAIVNGVQIKMATKVVMKEGRTYAPIGEVAQLLGITKAWNNDTKTATFENK